MFPGFSPTRPYGGRVEEIPGNEVEEGNAFFLDYQHGRRDVTCKPALFLGLKTIENSCDHENVTVQYACVANESTLCKTNHSFLYISLPSLHDYKQRENA